MPFVVLLLLWLKLASTGAAQDSSHAEYQVEQMSRPVFDDTGALAMLDGKYVVVVPGQGGSHRLTLPKLDAPTLLAVGEGVWLRAGDRIVYASLEPFRKLPSAYGNPVWETLPTSTVVPARARFTGSAVTCTSKGNHVDMTYEDEAGRAQTLTLPKIRYRHGIDHERELCSAHVANVRGRVWFATDDYVFSPDEGSWLLICERPAPPLWSRMRAFARYWSLDSVAPWMLLVACLLFAVITRLSSERPRSRALLRSLSASLLAPPYAFLSATTIELLGHAGQTSAHGPSGLLMLIFLSPFTLLSLPLPAVGIWLSERARTARTAGSFAHACVGTLVGTLFALPLTLPLLREYEPKHPVITFAAASMLIGACAAIAYPSARVTSRAS